MSLHTLPRLYISQALQVGSVQPLDARAQHYLKNVLRQHQNSKLRVFNGHDGEFLAEIVEISKKALQIRILEILRPQPQIPESSILIFAPIKKPRLELMIEKCTELGVTGFYPVLTRRTEYRRINTERLSLQIIEACEQSERMFVPKIHEILSLEARLLEWPHNINIYAGLERTQALMPLKDVLAPGPAAFLIGPEGGFEEQEKAMICSANHLTPFTLGENVLRCETAALACIAFHKLTIENL